MSESTRTDKVSSEVSKREKNKRSTERRDKSEKRSKSEKRNKKEKREKKDKRDKSTKTDRSRESSKKSKESKESKKDSKDDDKGKEPVADEENRGQWGNQVQFILSAVGLAVGLGNIWRFPAMAYENGGSAFLIPYMLCGTFFGLPMVYAEFTIGQYARVGPAKAFGRYASGFQGIGWTMALIAILVTIYYCVVIAWSGVFLGWIVSGQSFRWTTCDNEWNTANCVSQEMSKGCNGTYYFNGTCHDSPINSTRQPAEEFFMRYLTTRSTGIEDFGTINWHVFASLVVMWVLTAGILIKGVALMGYLSYVIVPLPYIVIIILFFRGVTLDGAMIGIDYYLLKPQWEKLANPLTWANALKQLLFSMSIGYGGLVSLSSYSKFGNNHFRDSLIVIVGDTLMSVVGGVAVFSILGYLSKQLGKPIEEVVQSGTSLAFIAYPEAMSTMPAHYVWEFLFFIMLFFLGLSSEIALVETLTGCIVDTLPKKKIYGYIVPVIVCLITMGLGCLMVTGAGWYWFSIYDDFTGTTAPCIVAALEVIMLTIYGWKNVKEDLVDMRGKPRFGGILRWIGPHSPVFAFFWATVCPLLALVVGGLTLWRDIPLQIKADKDDDGNVIMYTVPFWAEMYGWALNLGPLLAIPVFFIYRWGANNALGMPFSYLFRPNKDLKSSHRYFENKKLPHPEEFEVEDFVDNDASV